MFPSVYCLNAFTLSITDAEPSQGEEEKKRQKRGGKGMMKAKKKAEKEKKICLSRAPRGKKKFVTVITGLKTFGK